MSKRLVLFSRPDAQIFEQLSEVLFPKYLNERVFAYMPAEGDSPENVQYDSIWQEFTKRNNAKLVYIDNSKRGDEAEIEKDKLLSANILIITGGNTF